MFIIWNFLLTSLFVISIHSADFVFTKHTSKQNGRLDRSSNKIFGRGKSETIHDSIKVNQNLCSPNERWLDHEESCVCSPDGSRIDCIRPKRLQHRRKRNVSNKEHESYCNCNDGNCKTVNYCNCMRNFMICNCMCFCNSNNHFCNCMHNYFQTNYSSPINNHQFNRVCCCQPQWYNFCGCFGNTGHFHNRRKHFRAQCNCNYCDTEREKLDNVETKQSPNNNNLQGTKYPSSGNAETSSNNKNKSEKESIKTIDVKKLFEFCKTHTKYSNKKNEPIGQIDMNTMMDFCKQQINNDKTSKKQNDKKVQDKSKDNGSNRKEYMRNTIRFNRKKTAVPTLKTTQKKRTRVTTFKEKVLRNISRVLVGDYSSDYSLGLNSADLSSFGLKADSHIRRKVRKNIRTGRRNRLENNKKKIVNKDSSEDSSSEIESLGLRFPISREEEIEDSSQYNEDTKSNQDESNESEYSGRNIDKNKLKKRFKPEMDQIFNDMEFTTSEEESEIEKETNEQKPHRIKKERTFKNRTRKAIKQMKRSNYYNPNNRAYRGVVNENKLKRAANKRNRRFNQDNSVDDEFVFEQSNDLLHFSI